MSVTCDRHPTSPAWWRCPRCNKNLCPQCISKRATGHFQERALYFCPRCNVEAKTQDLSQVISPFWARLHRFFVYPLASIQSVSIILVLSLLSTLFNQAGFLSLLIKFLLWSVMVKYSFESLRYTAQGSIKPPPLSSKVLVDDYDIVFKQIALYIVLFCFFIFVVIPFGPLFIILYLLFCGLGLPSMLTILIINDSLIQAINPVMVVGLIIRIGWSYFLLLLFLLLLSGAPAALYFAFIQHLPENMQLFLSIVASNYYTLITYHMVGYVIFQYHDRVGYPVDLETILASIYPSGIAASERSVSGESQNRNADLLNEIGLLVQEGELDKAIDQIEQCVEIQEIDDLELSQRYVGLLRMRKQRQKLLNYAPHHLELIVKSGSKTKAIELYLECLSLDKSFAPHALVLFKIAGWLNESNKNKEAILALNALIKSYPKNTLVPKAYYRAALIFNERLKNADKARQILNGLIRKFPDHEITTFAKNYLSSL